MNTAARAAVIAFVGAAALLCPTDLSSCGPFFLAAVFSFPHQPGHPLAGTAQLGIVRPGFRRLYLYTAYRQLTSPLTPEETHVLSAPPAPEPAAVTPAMEEWVKARAKVAGLPKAPEIEVTVTHSSSTDYFQYTNCLDDAFHSAAVTLNSRMGKWNADLVKEWASGQDIVFSNCGGAESPALPPPATDPQLKADRAYQIAAAYFYANKLNEAETRFRQIAADRSSSWSDTSDYLIARVQIRRGTLQNDLSALKLAEAQLQSILADNSRKAMHGPARALLPFVRARLDPAARLTQLGQLLIKPDSELSRDLTDYRFLFDKLESAQLPKDKDELTDWLSTFHKKDAEHAAAEWRTKRSPAWLLAALAPLQPGNNAALDVIKAADQVRPDNPAYLTAAFHSIRLQLDSNPDPARTRLDGILKDAKLDLSDRNSFYAERMKVAANFEEFLKFAQRVPAGASWDEGAEVPPDTDPNNPLKDFKNGRTTLDADGAYVLNQRVPLKLMAAAATDKGVSLALRNNLAMAAWTRAVLFGDEGVAAQMTTLVPVLSAYGAEKDTDRRLFSALLLMLKNPGLHPYVDAGFGRETELSKIDEYRDNWWCSFGVKKEEQFYADYYKTRNELRELIELYPKAPPSAKFLPVADQAGGDAEWKRLSAMPAAPTHLSAAVVAYAQSHLDDPRVPEALALAVRSTRYGCTDDGTGKASKQAYDLLHAKFPKSDAAARTKFWYK
jgi:hypothetical protein